MATRRRVVFKHTDNVRPQLHHNGKVHPLYRHWGFVQAVRPMGGSRGTALPFLDHGTRRGVRGQRHAPAALYPRERPGTHCTGVWVGPRAGLDRCGKSRPPPGIDPPDRPARSQSIYRLSYPAHNCINPTRISKTRKKRKELRGNLTSPESRTVTTFIKH